MCFAYETDDAAVKQTARFFTSGLHSSFHSQIFFRVENKGDIFRQEHHRTMLWQAADTVARPPLQTPLTGYLLPPLHSSVPQLFRISPPLSSLELWLCISDWVAPPQRNNHSSTANFSVFPEIYQEKDFLNEPEQ
ncbi:MAG: hypothetical protein K6C08_07915 [Oscillospiraceae bacterium]|nr:hypothetical protein [Oscillospiraceae bacterium]